MVIFFYSYVSLPEGIMNELGDELLGELDGSSTSSHHFSSAVTPGGQDGVLVKSSSPKPWIPDDNPTDLTITD
jgi:hypothetical protein